jgi:hypothetical protein
VIVESGIIGAPVFSCGGGGGGAIPIRFLTPLLGVARSLFLVSSTESKPPLTAINAINANRASKTGTILFINPDD